MRHENSEFLTEFITDAGDYKLNKDYFAYLEFDDYACWVMADGIDSVDDKLSAKLVVESIIYDFSEKPTMKKRKLKKYIKNANRCLLEESKTASLKSTVLLVVSDYKSIVWANVGNTRLYRFSKGRLKNKSKDHSLAQMMLEAGELEAKKLNYHQERNNLTQYLGQKKRLKINVSKKIALKDDDTLLLASSGFWENLSDEKIRLILNEAEDNSDFLERLVNYILEEVEELDNYTLAAIFIEKAYQQQAKKSRFKAWFTKKRLALILLPIVILSSAYFTYNQIEKIRGERQEAIARQNLRLEEIRESMELEKQGDEFFNSQNYEQALTKYKAAEQAYEVIADTEKKEAVKAKQLKTEELIKAAEVKEQAQAEFEEENYESALEKYKQVESIFKEYNSQKLAEIETEIERVAAIIEAIDYEKQGDIFYQAESYLIAREQYQLAHSIYKENNLTEKQERMENNLTRIENNLKISQAEQFEQDGEEYLSEKEFVLAVDSYQQAKEVYQELGVESKAFKMEEAIEEINFLELYQIAQEHQEIAERKLATDDYEAAIEKYQLAQEKYQEATAEQQVSQMETKIRDINYLIEYQQAKELETIADEKTAQKDYEEAEKNYQQAKEIYSDLNKTEQVFEVTEKLEQLERLVEEDNQDSVDNKEDEDDSGFFLFF